MLIGPAQIVRFALIASSLEGAKIGPNRYFWRPLATKFFTIFLSFYTILEISASSKRRSNFGAIARKLRSLEGVKVKILAPSGDRIVRGAS